MIKWVIAYLNDRFLFLVAFILSFIFVSLYYYLSSNRFEVAYPLIIVVIILITTLSIDAYRYISFYKKINNSVSNLQYDLEPTLKEHKIVSENITRVHNYYMKRLYEVTNDQAEKDHFVTHWIHSLKTPVSVINVILQELESGNVTTRKAIADMKIENERTNHILEQVLSLSRLEDFSKDYLPEQVNLVELIKRQINLKKRDFIYGKIQPKVNICNNEIIVLTDDKWCSVLLDQILSNAIKYSEKNKGKSIFINIELLENKAILIIEDQGMGIPSYDLPRVFEPFFTGQNGRIEKNATGIGLYMAATIAEKLGHLIKIDSEVEKGTKVTITYLTKM